MSSRWEAQILRFTELTRRHTGLSFDATKRSAVAQTLFSHARTLEIHEQEEAAHHLESLQPDRVTLLVNQLAELAVGETYFFRHPSHFQALSTSVFCELKGRTQQSLPAVRVWSAACSSGEEPYSVAIALSRLYGDSAPKRVDIWATDIRTETLKNAERAQYRDWSFRGVDESVRLEFFEQSEGGWTPRKAIRRLVRFEQLNLLQPEGLRGRFDVIFCRNVLQYFNRTLFANVARTLERALAPGGALFVAPCEVHPRLFPSLELINDGEATYFQKSAPSPLTLSPKQRAAWPSAPCALTPSFSDVRSGVAPRAASYSLHHRANEFIDGVTWLSEGEWVKAERALLIAATRQPESPLPPFFLAKLCRSVGRSADAETYAERARALLCDLPEETPLHDAEGATAGHLLRVLGASKGAP